MEGKRERRFRGEKMIARAATVLIPRFGFTFEILVMEGMMLQRKHTRARARRKRGEDGDGEGELRNVERMIDYFLPRLIGGAKSGKRGGGSGMLLLEFLRIFAPFRAQLPRAEVTVIKRDTYIHRDVYRRCDMRVPLPHICRISVRRIP